MSDTISRLRDALHDRYAIERELGEGGMATVFLARDLKHNRPVALKVLKPELAAVVGAERFLAEIETTANLQHPHILPLFDSGEADGFLFYVMPFVEGESLRDMLDRERQLPVDEAVKIATNLAEALDFAHRKGVIHRDIKPANVLLLDGKPVLADFGIALAVGAAGGGRLTETGLSLGTPHYMSPEQATGEVSVGPTTDVYALGCVLYETLVGSPPHVGGTAQAILGKIITGTPDPITQHRGTVPPQVDAAVRKALERVPADRFRTAQAFADALADPAFRYGPGGGELAGAGESAGRSWRSVAIAGWALAAVAVALALLLRGSSSVTAMHDVGLPYDAPMGLNLSRNFDLSSDGRFIVYEASSEPATVLYYRSLVADEVRPIRGTEGAYGTPRISPDGSRVAFFAEDELRTVSLEGGAPSTLAQVSDPLGGTWTDEGLVLLSDEDGRLLRWVDPETGPARELEVDYCINPFLLEGDDAVLCGGGGTNAAFIRPLSDPERDRFFRRGAAQERGFTGVPGSDFRLIDDAYLVYMSPAGNLMAAAVLDRDSLTVGRPVTMVQGVRMEAYSGTGQYDLSDDGTLAYVPGRNAEVGAFVAIDEQGREAKLNVEAAAHVRFALSPDGLQLASVVEGVEDQELRLYELATGRAQVLDQDYFMGQPRWSPDGLRLAYTKRSDVRDESLYVLEPNSSGEPRLLTGGATDRPWMWVGGYLDDSTLLITSGHQGQSAVLLDPTADLVRPEPLGLSSLFLAVSPDQRSIVYQKQGATGVTVEPWPARDRSFVIDPLGGEPQWRSSAEVVYYRLDERGIGFYRTRVNPGGIPPFDDPVLWTLDPRFADTDGPSYTISPDGDLVYKRSPDDNRGYYVRVVPDWVSEMKRAVDEANR